MLEVKVRNNDVGMALKILKRKMIDEGILKDLKKHEYYLTKTQRRKEKDKEALKRLKKMKRIKEDFESGKTAKLKQKKLDLIRKNNNSNSKTV
jgi:small subunit ribosomal protein S21